MNKKRKSVKDYSHMSIAQLRRLKQELDAKESVQRLNKIHNENIQKQINNNILNEYSRIRNFLDSSLPVGYRDTNHLKKRMDQIEKMKIV